MTQKHTDQDPDTDGTPQPADEDDTEGHNLLNAQLGGVMANERAREAAKWANAEQARKRQNEHRKDGRR